MSRVPQSLDELRAMPAPRVTHIVEILHDTQAHGLKRGEQYEAHAYVMDPSDKWTLVRRLPDGHVPGCNAYRSQVKIVKRLSK